MIRLKAVHKGDAMDVRNPPVWTWMPINLILILLLYQGVVWSVELFGNITREDFDGRLPLARGAMLMAGIIALEIALFLVARLLSFGLQSRRYLFRADGIEVVKLLARVPVGHTFFTQDWVYGFTFVENERSPGGTLCFKADGDEYRLAGSIERWEAERFVEKLRAEGFVYSAEPEPGKRSATSAHTWLG